MSPGLATVAAGAPSPDGRALLAVRGLSKRFGGTRALVDVDFDVRPGEVHALLGENGAGKSTLIKILAGIHVPDAGEVVGPQGLAATGRPVPGVAFVHQDLGLVPTMSVAENLALGAGYARRAALIDWQETARRARAALETIDCGIAPDALVGRLSSAERSMVAIARALSVEAPVIVLDEPTATLPEADVARLHAVLARLRGRGLGIVYVTHRLDEVFRFADRASVLRDGALQASVAVARTSQAELIRHILGRKMEDVFRVRPAPPGAPVLAVHDLCSRHVGPLAFSVSAGEVLGLVGLRGAGHDVAGRMLFGDVRPRRGRIAIDGRTVAFPAPRDAIAAGIGFISSKRAEESLCAGLAVRENLFVNPRTAGLSMIGTANERRRARESLRAFDVRPPDPERPIALLSGGNQQKVVVARWLGIGRRILVLEEPTIGVDVGAKAELYRLMDAALGRGLAVVLISSDFEEVAGVAHRALVFDRGRIVAEASRPDLTVARLTSLASGAAA